jgi:succinate dehydrogenase / fumarate reductase cytochrome b subunit
MSKENFLTSSIGKKVVMSLTGLFLISFLVVHVAINSLLFLNDGGVIFNKAAGFMAHNIVIRIMEIGLFAGFILHIIQAYAVTLKNQKARPVKYAVTDGNANSKWYSRSMAVLGTLLLMFLVVHLGNFWVPTKKAVFAHEEHNTFEGIKAVFGQWYFVAIYLLGVLSLCYHLLHGFSSAFQSLGLSHPKWTPVIKIVGKTFTVIVCVLFALMPITVFMGWIK